MTAKKQSGLNLMSWILQAVIGEMEFGTGPLYTRAARLRFEIQMNRSRRGQTIGLPAFTGKSYFFFFSGSGISSFMPAMFRANSANWSTGVRRPHHQFSPIGGTAAVHQSRNTGPRVSHSESLGGARPDSAVNLSLPGPLFL